MIEAEFHWQDGRIAGFEIHGHAGWADPGWDVVCAAVSTLGQAALIGLEEVIGLPVAVQLDPAGRLACRLPARMTAEQSDRAEVILQTVYRSLRSIARDYGKQVRVRDRAVVVR